MPFKNDATRFGAEALAQRAVVGQSRESRRQRIGVARRNEERRPVVLQYFADLIQVRGDDAPAHRHVLEELGRRSEERRAVRVRDMRRDEHVAGGKMRGAVLLRDQTEPERAAIISSIAARTIALSTPAMLEGGRFTFPQEAYVAIAQGYP